MPTTVGYSPATPELVDFGSVVTPPLGGVQQRLNRLGNRFAMSVQLPPMPAEPLGRKWVSALNQGLTEGVIAAFPQPDFVVGSPGSPLVNGAGQIGSTMILDGFAANYPVKDGQFFNVIINGRRYLYHSRVDLAASAGGAISLPITPMIRVSPGDNAVCDFATPMIEGFLQGDPRSWTIDAARTVGLSFSVMEAA